jgi:hypothetical protein
MTDAFRQNSSRQPPKSGLLILRKFLVCFKPRFLQLELFLDPICVPCDEVVDRPGGKAAGRPDKDAKVFRDFQRERFSVGAPEFVSDFHRFLRCFCPMGGFNQTA